MIGKAYHIIRLSISRFIADDCMTHASSLSYVFLLSIIPFSALTVFIIHGIQAWLFPHVADVDNVVREIFTEEITQVIPFISRQWIQTYVINAQGGASFKIINVLMLPVISGLLFKTLEASFRKIFKLPTRHLLKGQFFYALMSVFLILFLFIANFAWSIFSPILFGIIGFFSQNIYFEPFFTFFSGPIAFFQSNLISMLIQVIFFSAASKIFLNIHIRKTYIFISGLSFWLLWILARTCFGLYIHHISKINVLYGSLSSIVIILMWMFYSSVVLLFAVEVLYTLHTGDYKKL